MLTILSGRFVHIPRLKYCTWFPRESLLARGERAPTCPRQTRCLSPSQVSSWVLLFLRALPSVSKVTAQSSAAITQAIDTLLQSRSLGCGFSGIVLVSSILPLVHTRTSVCQAVFSGSG